MDPFHGIPLKMDTGSNSGAGISIELPMQVESGGAGEDGTGSGSNHSSILSGDAGYEIGMVGEPGCSGLYQQDMIEVVELDEDIACKVCSDRATGNHYNVYTCEGCKGFFKRTVQKQLVYQCRGVGSEGRCEVTKASRNNCQSCRFNKCLKVGMQMNGVREDRAPGGKPRRKKLCTTSSGEGSPTTIADPAPASPMAGLFKTDPVKAEPDEFADKLGVIDKLINARPDLIPGPSMKPPGPPLPDCGPPPGFPIPPGFSMPPGGPPMPGPGASQQEITTMEMMKYGYIELRMVIQWAKKVPGFNRIGIQDQMSLLKACFMDLNVLRVAYRSLDLVGQNKIRFAEDLDMVAEDTMNLGWGTDLIMCTIEYIRQLQSLALDKAEFAALNALVLTYPDAKGIEDKQSVTNLQTLFLECLRHYITVTYPAKTKRYTKILLRLPVLREVSAKAKESFLKLNMSGILQMDKLAGEMLEYDDM